MTGVKSEGTGLQFIPVLLFPGGNDSSPLAFQEAVGQKSAFTE
jgi:hypothetical protein